jgi:hypothetical protein
MDLIYFYRIFYSTATDYTFFSVTPRSFSKIDHILSYKASLNKYKKIEITSFIIYDSIGIKLE